MKKLLIALLCLLSGLASAADYWPPSCLQQISIGQTINGEVSTTSDCSWWFNSDPSKKYYTDVYTFAGTGGQQIVVAMNGVAGFDTDLTLVLGNLSIDSALTYVDDDGSDTNARIPQGTGYYTLPSSGTYFIWASSPLANKGGGYSLTLSSPSAVPPVTGSTQTVTEFFHPQFNHYFITAYADEAASLAAGNLPPWTPTGQTFKVWSNAGTSIVNVCRFFSNTFGLRSSHFYSHAAAECPSLASRGVWQLESSNAFYMMRTADGTCPTGTSALYRLYNDGMSDAPNHRYTVSTTIRSQMMAAGWIPEGYGANGVFACLPVSDVPPVAGGSATGVVGSNTNGIVTTSGGQSIYVPGGAIPASTSGQATSVTFSVETGSVPPQPLPSRVAGVGLVTKFGPDGFSFAWPLTTTLPLPGSMTKLSDLRYMRYDPGQSKWVTYPGLALNADSTGKIVSASVPAYDLGYDSLAQPTAQTVKSLEATVHGVTAANKNDKALLRGLQQTISAESALVARPPPRALSSTAAGAMRWNGSSCHPGDGVSSGECHHYLVAKNYTPATDAQRESFAEFNRYWYNLGNGCVWNAATSRFEGIGDGNCGTFRTGSDPPGDPAATTVFPIDQGRWEFCVTGSQWTTPGGSLPLPGRWTYSKLIPVNITQASENTCQTFQCWSHVVDIAIAGGTWKEPAQLTSCPTSTNATQPVGTGDFQSTLTWINTSTHNADVDLHLYGPNSMHVSYSVKVSADGSVSLDRDWKRELGNAIENIFSTGSAPMPSGQYRLTVLLYGGNVPMDYNVRVIRSGVTRTYSGTLTSVKQEIEIEKFTK